ncbi:MAG: rhodanese-like domain-containing protein [Planctomycetaceae bacterium]
MQTITRDQVQEKLRDDDFTVVEVLGSDQFDEFHLPGAINVPLGEDFDEEIQQTVPDKQAPVIVYCKNESCEASPKAAKRMEALGYTHVFDYEAGKQDWKEAGLPVEK